MKQGERQVAPDLSGIRRDHVARYEWAADFIRDCGADSAVDFACGIGYGSRILAERGGCSVLGVDLDREAIEYARAHYAHARVTHHVSDGESPGDLDQFMVAVCFETIEHLWDPSKLLRSLRESATWLLASVPNEDVFPWDNTAYHHRHYTSGEFETLLNACGWEVAEWCGQAGPESEVEKSLNGRTLIAVCRPREFAKTAPEPPKEIDLSGPVVAPETVPEHVAILALGPSVGSYLEFTKRIGGRRKFCDEVWAINALGNVFDCDRVFHMDDVRIQEIRAAAKPDGNIAALLPWLKAHKGPIYTSRPHPEYPGLVPFPLEAVVRDTGYAYMNSTAAYAVAFAVFLKVKKITLFGMDFTYAHSHHSEKGRACVEFWLGIAAARGIKISIPQKSSLMDGCEPPRDRLYGYDTVDVTIGRDHEGLQTVRFTERHGPLPTADEIERRYDHTAHPNPLMQG